VNGFIAEPDADEAVSQSDIRAHRGYDRRLLADQEEDLHDVARGLDERYKQQRGAYNPFGGSGESENIPQRMLMPSVEDANLWMIRVKVRVIVVYALTC
jgi:transcription elongation factor SPT5